MTLCVRCGGEGGITLQLATVYNAVLCIECTNGWIEYLNECDEWHRLRRALISRDAAIHRGESLVAVRIYDHDIVHLENQLFDTARQWVNDGA